MLPSDPVTHANAASRLVLSVRGRAFVDAAEATAANEPAPDEVRHGRVVEAVRYGQLLGQARRARSAQLMSVGTAAAG